MSTRDAGREGEARAAAYLQKRGYEIRDMNYRCPLGELDIVAMDGDVLVFIEVKSRSSLAFGHPQEGITRAKQRKLAGLAAYYMEDKGFAGHKCRFDVVALLVDRNRGGVCSIELITDAFCAPQHDFL